MLVAERNPMERRIKSTDELQIETVKFAVHRYWQQREKARESAERISFFKCFLQYFGGK